MPECAKRREAHSKGSQVWVTRSDQLLGALLMKLCTQRQLTSLYLSLFILSELLKQGNRIAFFPRPLTSAYKRPGHPATKTREKCVRETSPELTYLLDKLCNQENTLRGMRVGQCSPTPL